MLNCILTGITKQNLIIITSVLLAIAILLLLIKYLVKKKNEPRYYVKDALLTATEIKYYNVIRSVIGDDFLVYPQINLASVIDKKGGNNFRNELFRNIDFAIFDYNFRPLVLIEINDNTHFRKDRIERDEKVAVICKKAGIPLITFWVKDGINEDYIAKQLNTAIRYYNKRK